MGDRLRKENLSEEDLRLLDTYRRSFNEAYEEVVRKIREMLGLEPTGRPAKSTTSIVEKLRRESIRLSQMQDIAGCRVIVTDIVEQNNVVDRLTNLFDEAIVIDRREKPSHGYRAVHLIVRVNGDVVEVQIRTMLQHLWAELCEKISDVYDKSIKYGGGDPEVLSPLLTISEAISTLEDYEKRVHELLNKYETLKARLDVGAITTEQKQEIVEIDREVDEVRDEVISRKVVFTGSLRDLLLKIAPR